MGVPINNVSRRVVYAASGTGPYAFTFEILAAADIAVYKDDTLLTLTTDYTVTINANGTGSITLTASPTGATQIAIVGNRTIQRLTDFVTGGDLFANTINDELDQQTIFAQQNAEGLDRSLKAPQTDPTSINMTLPRASVRANKTLAFDTNGNPTTGEVIGDNRGNWAAGTAYNKRDIVKDTSNGNIYYANTAHTSSGSQPISSNADSAKWDLIVDNAAAGASASAAAASASAAASSASAASTSASNASSSASSAASSASAASTSASNASTSATNAASSASTASTQASNAATSATNAANSATSASNSASTATTQATNASNSASSASTSATNAANSASSASSSASSASSSASSASTSASNASTSATNAASSATAAAASATSAAASYDSFDDRYLGAKTSDPTLDNDGNALLTGALYFNSSTGEMKVYSGSAWVSSFLTAGAQTIAGVKTFSSNPILSAGTANGVAYLNGSKVLTTGSALTFDGTNLATTANTQVGYVYNTTSVNSAARNWATTTNDQVFGDFAIRQSTALGGNPLSAGRILYYINPTGESVWSPGGTEGMRLTSTGLGIGTSSPGAKLHAVSAGSASTYTTTAIVGDGTYPNSGFASLEFKGFIGGNGYTSAIGTNGGQQLRFYTPSTFGVAPTLQMTLNESGNLGIGTSSPAARLHAYGTSGAVTVMAEGAVGSSAYGRLEMRGRPAGAGQSAGYIVAASTAGGQAATNIGAIDIAQEGASGNASFMAFSTHNGTSLAEDMRLDSRGNLGLGVTPSAWSGNKAVQVNARTSLYSSADGGAVVGNNLYYNGTNNIYIASNYATAYQQNAAGQHIWYNAPSGTAGNAISFTQAMTLDASGNLGVGATSLGSFRFKAQGTGGILGGNAYFVGLVGDGSASNKGVGLGYDSSSQTGIVYAETASAASNLAFWTYSGSVWGERARITSGGYFKASNTGTYQSSTSTYHELRNDANANTVRISNTITSGYTDSITQFSFTGYTPNNATAVFLWCNDTTAVRTKILSDGGIANYSANDVNLSDRREKTNLAPAKSYLNTICAIPVQTFNYIDQSEDDPGLTLGVVAQDVQVVAPELVMESNWGTKDDPKMRLSIYQTDLQYALMKCIQELKAQNDDLRARVAQLEAK